MLWRIKFSLYLCFNFNTALYQKYIRQETQENLTETKKMLASKGKGSRKQFRFAQESTV